MPQLDKLAFGSQIFWLLMIFIFSYYFYIQICVVRLKFSLGLKRYIFQLEKYNHLYEFFSSNKMQRSELLFFFENGFGNVEQKVSKKFFVDISSSNIIQLFLQSPVGGALEKILVFLNNAISPLTNYLKSEYVFIINFEKSYELFFFSSSQRIFNQETERLLSFSFDLNIMYISFENYIMFFLRLVKFYVFNVLFSFFFDLYNGFLIAQRRLFVLKVMKIFDISESEFV